MQADTHTLLEYPLGKPLEAKLLKEYDYYGWIKLIIVLS